MVDPYIDQMFTKSEPEHNYLKSNYLKPYHSYAKKPIGSSRNSDQSFRMVVCENFFSCSKSIVKVQREYPFVFTKAFLKMDKNDDDTVHCPETPGFAMGFRIIEIDSQLIDAAKRSGNK